MKFLKFSIFKSGRKTYYFGKNLCGFSILCSIKVLKWVNAGNSKVLWGLKGDFCVIGIGLESGGD